MSLGMGRCSGSQCLDNGLAKQGARARETGGPQPLSVIKEARHFEDLQDIGSNPKFSELAIAKRIEAIPLCFRRAHETLFYSVEHAKQLKQEPVLEVSHVFRTNRDVEVEHCSEQDRTSEVQHSEHIERSEGIPRLD